MNTNDIDTSAAIARALEHWTKERAQAREQACDEARKLVSGKLGKLEQADFEALFRLFHTDFRDGRATGDRFSRAFAGSSQHRMLEDLSTLNHWTERLWLARSDDEVADVLDGFWKSKVRGAGHSYPTVLLYTRGPERYWPLMTAISQGYQRLSGNEAVRRRGRAYLDYVRWVRKWREQYEIPEHAVDLVLSVIGESGAEKPPQAPDDAPPAAPDHAPQLVAEPIELRLDLRMLDSRTCSVRIAGTEVWPTTGALLPPQDESIAIARQGNPSHVDALGRQLFAALFHEQQLAEHYESARDASAEACVPLRLVLCMHADADAPDSCSIARHSWETLVDPQRGPLAIDLDVRLVRTLARLGPLPIPSPACPLRVHVGFANPIGYPLLDLHAEWGQFHRLEQAARDSRTLELTVHPFLGLQTLDGFLHQTEVFHYAGHGEPGELILEGPDRQPQPLDADALRARLTQPVPHLVVLNACHGSVGGAGWISVAEAFSSRGVAAVVAMNGALADPSALLFAEELHERLAAGVDVELAVQRARWRAFAERGRSWFMPVLWTRAPSSFALIDPAVARADSVVQEQIAQLDERAVVLEQRVEVLRRLSVREVDPVHREELADALIEEAEQIELERLLDDDNEIERLLGRIRDRADDPNAELREVATTLRRELVPQLGAAADALPALLSALRSVLDRPAEPSEPPPLAAPPIDDSEPLRLVASVDSVVAGLLAKTKLVLDPAIVRRCVLHLLAGRHLVLAGPPGTGKSTLAKALAEAFGYRPRVATANPDWTTFDTIGGLAPQSVHDAHGRAHLSYPFQPGWVLRAVEANWEGERTWLVIDEMNRAPLDQAFGELFTALVDHRLHDPRRSVPLPIPQNFRLICTTNTADRRLLFEFSEALKRRFAFVAIPAFEDRKRGLNNRERLLDQLSSRPALTGIDLDQLSARGPDGKNVIDHLEQVVDRIRVLFPLGLAQVLDVLTYVAVGSHYGTKTPDAQRELLGTALIDNVLPLLEAQPASLLDALADLLDGRIDAWIDAFLASQSSYRPEPGGVRIAVELLDQLGEHELTFAANLDWTEQFTDQRKAKIIAATPALECADELAKTLRRLAAERHG